ncbi:lysozyme [Leifsonia shinshuensis]|nr:lysozyme [Leifsonia shinshuensis]
MVAGVVAVAVAAGLILSGVLWPNRVFAAALPVRGVDVSSYQGRIDWPVLSRQGVDFAIIKATEGSGDEDERFEANWRDARASGLIVGAYHFLSFDSSAERQAQNIFRTVPADAGTLPVTVDVELYGDYLSAPPSRERVQAVLDPLLDQLEKHYGRPAILYATGTAYDRYLRGAYRDNPIWYRSVVLPPMIPDGRRWTFWQYSDRERLAGYDGDESFIDMDAFGGSRQALETLLQPTGQ